MGELWILTREFKRNRLVYALLFTFLALSGLALAYTIEKPYRSYVSLALNDNNTLNSLLTGAAYLGDKGGRAVLVREIILKRETLEPLLEPLGLLSTGASLRTREQEYINVLKNISVKDLPGNLIVITYEDVSAQRAFKLTRTLGDTLIDHLISDATQATRDSYQYLETEVKLYANRLQSLEERIRTLGVNPDNLLDVDQRNARLSQLALERDEATVLLDEMRQRAVVLRSKLRRESRLVTAANGASGGAERIAQLSGEIEGLLTNYTERHPDVVRRREELRQLQRSARLTSSRQEVSRVYQDLSGEEARISSEIAGLEQRVRSLQAQSNAIAKTANIDSVHNELLRQYALVRDTYTDLLKQRETARLAMNLDTAKQRSLVRIQQPARLPVLPSGLRFSHLAVLAMLATLFVLGAVAFLHTQLTRMVRAPIDIEHLAGLPVLSVLPEPASTQQRVGSYLISTVCVVLIGLVIAAYVTAGVMRILGAN